MANNQQHQQRKIVVTSSELEATTSCSEENPIRTIWFESEESVQIKLISLLQQQLLKELDRELDQLDPGIKREVSAEVTLEAALENLKKAFVKLVEAKAKFDNFILEGDVISPDWSIKESRLIKEQRLANLINCRSVLIFNIKQLETANTRKRLLYLIKKSATTIKEVWVELLKRNYLLGLWNQELPHQLKENIKSADTIYDISRATNAIADLLANTANAEIIRNQLEKLEAPLALDYLLRDRCNEMQTHLLAWMNKNNADLKGVVSRANFFLFFNESLIPLVTQIKGLKHRPAKIPREHKEGLDSFEIESYTETGELGGILEALDNIITTFLNGNLEILVSETFELLDRILLIRQLQNINEKTNASKNLSNAIKSFQEELEDGQRRLANAHVKIFNLKNYNLEESNSKLAIALAIKNAESLIERYNNGISETPRSQPNEYPENTTLIYQSNYLNRKEKYETDSQRSTRINTEDYSSTPPLQNDRTSHLDSDNSYRSLNKMTGRLLVYQSSSPLGITPPLGRIDVHLAREDTRTVMSLPHYSISLDSAPTKNCTFGYKLTVDDRDSKAIENAVIMRGFLLAKIGALRHSVMECFDEHNVAVSTYEEGDKATFRGRYKTYQESVSKGEDIDICKDANPKAASSMLSWAVNLWKAWWASMASTCSLMMPYLEESASLIVRWIAHFNQTALGKFTTLVVLVMPVIWLLVLVEAPIFTSQLGPLAMGVISAICLLPLVASFLLVTLNLQTLADKIESQAHEKLMDRIRQIASELAETNLMIASHNIETLDKYGLDFPYVPEPVLRHFDAKMGIRESVNSMSKVLYERQQHVQQSTQLLEERRQRARRAVTAAAGGIAVGYFTYQAGESVLKYRTTKKVVYDLELAAAKRATATPAPATSLSVSEPSRDYDLKYQQDLQYGQGVLLAITLIVSVLAAVIGWRKPAEQRAAGSSGLG